MDLPAWDSKALDNRPAQLYIIRHGTTSMNSGDGRTEKFRAWGDPPLTDEGIQAAHKAGQFLADKGISHIFASDLQRAVHTGQIVSQYTHAPVSPVHGLRPWNLGEFTGKPVEPNLKKLESFQNQPDKPLPGGESYNNFLHRWNTTLHTLVSHSQETGQPIALVTHTRNINALKVAVSGKKKAPIHSLQPPGGILKMDVQNGKVHLTDEDTSEGLKDESKKFQE